MGNSFIMPGRIVYGENALENAKPLLAGLGYLWLYSGVP